MTSNKKQNFLYGSIILIASTIIVKIIGCFFKIPLQNLIGSVGMGYFNTAYALFNLIYALSVAGLPMAVARMVAKSFANKRYSNIKNILKISNICFCITGLTGSTLMILFANFYVKNFTGNPDAYWCTIMMAPSIFFCCISSAYRGYYEGLQNMYPTAIAQIIESITRLIAGYLLAWYIIKIGWQQYYQTGIVFNEIIQDPNEAENSILKFASAGAILGVTISTFLGTIYIWLRHVIKGDGISNNQLLNSIPSESNKNITTQLLKIAIPICLASTIMNIASFIDTKTMVKQLSFALSKDPSLLLLKYINLLPNNIKINKIPNFLYGAYSGMAINIYNLIPSLTTAFSISILPVITAASTKNDYTAIKQNMECVLRTTNIICIPPSIALIILSKPILLALYGSRKNEALIASSPLKLLGLAALLVSLAMPINSMLQAVGKLNIPAKLMTIGVILKLIINQYLISIPSINIKGAPIGSIACYSIVVFGGLKILLKTTQISINKISVFIKPFFASIICVSSAYISLELLNHIKILSSIHHGLFSLILAILISIIIYLISLFLLNTIEKSDILMLPSGNKILKILEKYKILR